MGLVGVRSKLVLLRRVGAKRFSPYEILFPSSALTVQFFSFVSRSRQGGVKASPLFSSFPFQRGFLLFGRSG